MTKILAQLRICVTYGRSLDGRVMCTLDRVCTLIFPPIRCTRYLPVILLILDRHLGDILTDGVG